MADKESGQQGVRSCPAKLRNLNKNGHLFFLGGGGNKIQTFSSTMLSSLHKQESSEVVSKTSPHTLLSYASTSKRNLVN